MMDVALKMPKIAENIPRPRADKVVLCRDSCAASEHHGGYTSCFLCCVVKTGGADTLQSIDCAVELDQRNTTQDIGILLIENEFVHILSFFYHGIEANKSIVDYRTRLGTNCSMPKQINPSN